MTQEFQSTKDFSVGDLFLDREGNLYCYIAKIYQWKKGSQYQHELKYFRDQGHYWSTINTARLKDRITYSGWKHVPVVK